MANPLSGFVVDLAKSLPANPGTNESINGANF